jgi:ubiquinone/menaquinone biosynthesis C-methylase UbiE
MAHNERTFNPADAHKLEDPARLEWLPPADVLARLPLSPGMNVADIGAGTGYFSLPVARRIAPGGRVFAVDLQPEMLAILRAKMAAGGGVENVEPVEGSASASTLGDGSCDLILIANVWHELDDCGAALAEAFRILRAGGRLALLDWRTDVTRPPGPPLGHRISQEAATRMLIAYGWSVLECGAVGAYSYLLLAAPPR